VNDIIKIILPDNEEYGTLAIYKAMIVDVYGYVRVL